MGMSNEWWENEARASAKRAQKLRQEKKNMSAGEVLFVVFVVALAVALILFVA